MRISKHIDREVPTASILEDTRVMTSWLREYPYIAIADEDNKVIGIITLKDIQANPEALNVLDCDFIKPVVNPEQVIMEALTLMQKSNTDYLPVYYGTDFLGVISLQKIASRLSEILEENRKYYQSAIHDLRNPIGNLHGLTKMLKENPSASEIRDITNFVLYSSKHAMDILDDLLYLESDKERAMETQTTEMNSFFKQCINECTGLSEMKKIQIESVLSTETLVKHINQTRFKRAIQNIIANAIKFSYPNSIIRISSKIADQKIILTVVDYGIGIPSALQADIFKEFTPAGRTGTNGETTTGLGLCFAKTCIEKHGGDISFKSVEGKGTSFYISL